jgi:mannitol operon transcriptional antiterminator
MTSRLLAVIKLLAESSDYTTVEQIAEATGAGVRTIHRDLEILERSLSLRGVRLERRRGVGVRLIDPVPKRLMESADAVRFSAVSESGQRPLLILLYMILAADWIKLSEIAHVLFVSDSTVSSDISALEEILPGSIYIERQKGTGVRMIADETEIRMLFLSAFPNLVPVYLLYGDESGVETENGEERLLRLIGVRACRDRFFTMIRAAEDILGHRLSPTSSGMLYSYLFLLARRIPVTGNLQRLAPSEMNTPEPYIRAARCMLAADSGELLSVSTEEDQEVLLLARVLSSLEIAAVSADSVENYLGNLWTPVNSVIEHTLGRLEVSRRVWLHNDRLLLNYLRMTLAAAARRIDLGIPRWREIGLHPYPGLEDTPEAAALVSQFMIEMEERLPEFSPSQVRREIHEASLALGAHIEVLQTRHAPEFRVRILCVEGLGMSDYIAALVRDVFPRGVLIDSHWDPGFEENQTPGEYDLVVSSFPLKVRGCRHVLIRADSSPQEIRGQLRETAAELETRETNEEPEKPVQKEKRREVAKVSEQVQELSLPVIMSVISGFFVEKRVPELGLLAQAVAALARRGACDNEIMIVDFERRESYGSLIFEELNVRILHCRTEGIPEPRAGVIQTVPMEPTVLVLAAPLTASPVQTHALSEIVIALTDFGDFAEVLSRGNRREIQGRLLTLFSQKFG